MAALKLKGYENANTNLPRNLYHTEPFMMVRPFNAKLDSGFDSRFPTNSYNHEIYVMD